MKRLVTFMAAALAAVSLSAQKKGLETFLTDSIDTPEELLEHIENLPNIEVGKGITFRPKNDSYEMTIRFRMQNMVGLHFNDGFDLKETEAQIKRLRLRFDGYIFSPKFIYSIQLGFSGYDAKNRENGQVNIIRDAIVYYRPSPDWNIGFGQTKLKTNRARINSSSALQFVDRSIVNSEFGGDRAELLRFLKNSGKTIKQFREDQKKDIIVNYMKGTMRQGVYEISPKTILEYYEKNKQKWYSAASAKLRMITLKTSMTATLEDNRKVAADIEAKIAKGADFAELAKVYSKDESSIRGGDWGWIKKGELNPVLDKEVFALKEGQTTKPIEIGEMIFILKVEQKRPEGIQDIDDVRSQIEAAIADYNSRAMYRKWIEGLRAKAYIKIYQ